MSNPITPNQNPTPAPNPTPAQTPVPPIPLPTQQPQQQPTPQQSQSQQPQAQPAPNNGSQTVANMIGQGHQLQSSYLQLRAQGANSKEAILSVMGQFTYGNVVAVSGNTVHEVSASVGNATEYLSVLSKDKADAFFNQRYDQLQQSERLIPLLTSRGIISNNAETSFVNQLAKDCGFSGISDTQLQELASSGVFTVTTNFNQATQVTLKNIARAGSVTKIKGELAKAGLNPSALPNDLVGLRGIVDDIVKFGVHKQIVTPTTALAGKAQAVLQERENNNQVLNNKNPNKRGSVIRELRQNELAEINKTVPDFDAKQSQIRELQVAHPDGNFRFTNAQGNMVVVDSATRDKLLNFEQTFGSKEQATESLNHNKGRFATVLMDNDTKSGYHFTVTTSKASAAGAKLVYRAAVCARDNIEIAHIHSQMRKNQKAIVSLKKSTPASMQQSGQFTQQLKSLQSEQQNLRESLDMMADLKKDRKEVLQLGRDRRLKKKKGGDDYIKARNSYHNKKFEMKAKYLDKKQEIYKNRNNGKISSNIKKKQDRLVSMNSTRISREKWIADTKDKILTSKLGKALGGIKSKIQMVLDPLAALKRWLAKIKMKILMMVGKGMLYFLGGMLTMFGQYFMIAAVAAFFVFAFTDNTNYGQMLIMDMQDTEAAFVDIAKKDTVMHFANGSGAQTLAEEVSPIYDHTGLTIEDNAEAHIRKLYTYETKEEISTLGSYVPYFGLARTRFADEIGNDLYGTMRGYMQYLYVGSHGVEMYDYEKENMYYCNYEELLFCNNPYYHNDGEEVLDRKPWDSKGECDNWDVRYEKNKDVLLCTKEEHDHDSDCYECLTIEHNHSDACYSECKNKTAHTHTDDCRELLCTLPEHTHSMFCTKTLVCTKEEHDHRYYGHNDPDNCYKTDAFYRCLCHCAGHVKPIVDLYAKEKLSNIADTDGGLTSPMFYPPKALEKNTDWLEKTYTADQHKLIDWKQAWGTTLADEYSLVNRWNAGDYTAANLTIAKEYEDLRNTFPFIGWRDGDLDYAASMIGTMESGYREGFELWKGFEVYFPDDCIKELTYEERENWKTNVISQYQGNGFSISGNVGGVLVNAALLNLGTYKYDMNTENSSLDYINHILNAALKPTETDEAQKIKWTFYDFERLAVNVNKSIGWGKAETYEDLLPGSLLLDTDRNLISIYLGTYHDKFHVIDCSPYVSRDAIRYLGWEEMNRRYTKTVSSNVLNNTSLNIWN